MAKLQLEGLWEKPTSSSTYIAADLHRYGFALPQNILMQNSGLELGQLLWQQVMLMAVRVWSVNTTLHPWPSSTD